jgi:outer membrane protein assembly factor BamB
LCDKYTWDDDLSDKDNRRLRAISRNKCANKYYTINIDDKSITWEKKLPAGVYGSPIMLKDGDFQNEEYFLALGCQDSKFYFIDALTGETIWNFETQGPIVSSPFYTNGHFFVSSNDGYVYAINRNQNLSWKAELPPYTYTSPLVANRTVYFNTPQGIMGYDYLTGELASQYKNEELGGEGNYWSSAILTTNTGLVNHVYEIIYPGPVNYKIELY